MKASSVLVPTALVALVLLAGCGAQSGGGKDQAKGPAEKKAGMESMPAKETGASSAELITCPVSGHQVAKDQAYTINYEGKKISFCCSDCEAPFRAEPAKYMAALEKGESAEPGHSGH